MGGKGNKHQAVIMGISSPGTYIVFGAHDKRESHGFVASLLIWLSTREDV